MNITLDDLTVKNNQSHSSSLTEDWLWLVGKDKRPILISAIGDLFLEDESKKIYWLDTGAGNLELIADNIQDFQEKLQNNELANEWLLINLVINLKESGKILDEGQIYTYKILPVLGGEYTVDNFEPTDIEVHFSVTGQLHRQIKDLPPGTKINNIKFK